MRYMPQEIEVWYVIPAIRSELAKEMARGGIVHKEIARHLGLTEPAVSQYLNSKRATDVKFSRAILASIHAAAKKIIKDDMKTMPEIQAICKKIRKSGQLCKISCKHQKIDKHCHICME